MNWLMLIAAMPLVVGCHNDGWIGAFSIEAIETERHKCDRLGGVFEWCNGSIWTVPYMVRCSPRTSP